MRVRILVVAAVLAATAWRTCPPLRVSGYPTLLDAGAVAAQHARDGEVRQGPFTTDLWLLDVTSGERTLLASFDEDIPHRAYWPTVRPRSIVGDVLVLGAAE